MTKLEKVYNKKLNFSWIDIHTVANDKCNQEQKCNNSHKWQFMFENVCYTSYFDHFNLSSICSLYLTCTYKIQKEIPKL